MYTMIIHISEHSSLCQAINPSFPTSKLPTATGSEEVKHGLRFFGRAANVRQRSEAICRQGDCAALRGA